MFMLIILTYFESIMVTVSRRKLRPQLRTHVPCINKTFVGGRNGYSE